MMKRIASLLVALLFVLAEVPFGARAPAFADETGESPDAAAPAPAEGDAGSPAMDPPPMLGDGAAPSGDAAPGAEPAVKKSSKKRGKKAAQRASKKKKAAAKKKAAKRAVKKKPSKSTMKRAKVSHKVARAKGRKRAAKSELGLPAANPDSTGDTGKASEFMPPPPAPEAEKTE